ncbi:S8 family serine peptidase [Streptomyces sp. cmx-10-25]|uniref:S8 family serine peptidase n=1 Tax=Streptomyces sp. cmx-10-25 TaxID=2790919 RepID=UPI00397F1A81
MVSRTPIRTALPAVLALGALVAGTVALPAHADPAERPEVTALTPPVANTVHRVRLITGDSVVVTGTGAKADVAFQPDADSPGGAAQIVRHGADITVVPEEARPLLDAGVLDPRLFEVDDLIAQGYTDGRDLPLIVQNADGSAKAPEGAHRTRPLRAVRGLAARVAAEDAGRMWEGLRAEADGASHTRLADGVKHVWLDGRVTAQLDRSVPQIGAPQAWAAGYDGTGVKVAVLDTGIDAGHPDIAGALVEARNFSDSADAVDRHGHGTHVASTVLGSGAASGGLYKGVAPKARLLVGKVLGDNGNGSDSNLLAGMEWAAHSGARVVNMSLGAPVRSDGTDPVSTAMNTLTAATGALFVVAAGNTGPDATTLGAPGVADSALTVAAVDAQDRMASFSSRGPRYLDHAIKPDIAGPGVDIVAARATGTAMGTPLDASYTRASGTSMATPHVSGAAAILAQRHPDWKAADLKGALMASAKVLGHSAYAEGSGRVDIPAALNQTVWANNASFGRFLYGQKVAPVTRKLTFHNTADQDTTVGLGAVLKDERGQVHDGVLTLGADTLTIPARGSADVTVTAAPDAVTGDGAFTGTVTAEGNGVTAHATVAFQRELRRYAIRVRATMPDGTPVPSGARLALYDLRSNKPPVSFSFGAGGVATTDVLPGRYTVLGNVPGASGNAWLSLAFPDITVTDQDVSLTVDGTEAKEVTLQVPARTDRANVGLAIARRSDEQQLGVSVALSANTVGTRFYALPTTTPARDGYFHFTKFWNAQSPVYLAKALLPGGQLDLNAAGFNFAARFDGTRHLKVVDVGHGTEAELAATGIGGRLALVRQGTEQLPAVLKQLAAKAPAGVMVVLPDDRWTYSSTPVRELPVFSVTKSLGDRVAAAAAEDTVVVRLTGTLNSGYAYKVVKAQPEGIGQDQSVTTRQQDFATVRVSDHLPAADRNAAAYTQEAWTGLATETGVGLNSLPFFEMGSSRTEYLWADRTTWSRAAYPANAAASMVSSFRSYEAGGYEHQRWFRSVLHPATWAGAPSAARPSRDKSSMNVAFYPWTSADGRFVESGSPRIQEQKTFRVYADGQLLGSTPSTGAQVKNLPPEAHEYRFELDQVRTAPWWSVSTRAHTEWTLTSAAPEGGLRAELPILEADYDLEGVSIDNTVRAGRSHDLTLTFRMGAGRPVELTEATIEVSYDGGSTWRTRPVALDRATARTALDVPKDATGVSLRVSGTDVSGSAITQTVTDAVRAD